MWGSRRILTSVRRRRDLSHPRFQGAMNSVVSSTTVENDADSEGIPLIRGQRRANPSARFTVATVRRLLRSFALPSIPSFPKSRPGWAVETCGRRDPAGLADRNDGRLVPTAFIPGRRACGLPLASIDRCRCEAASLRPGLVRPAVPSKESGRGGGK